MPEDRRSSATLKSWQWFLLAAAVPLMHCACRLNLDLWHDEIYTVEYFVRQGPAFIVTDYSAPNNHVLYSLLLWPFSCISVSNVMLRLPSFILSVGTLWTVFALAKQLRGLPCAVLSTALLGLNQMFLIFTMQVRGYTLSMFLAAALALVAVTDALSRWRRLVAVALVGAALLYVMPTNVLFFVALAITACVRRRKPAAELVREAASWSLATALAVLCYLPIVGQLRHAAVSSSPSTWSYLPVIAGNFFSPATHDLVWLAPLFAAGLAARVFIRGDKPRHLALPALSLAVIAGAFLMTVVLKISPFERNYCPLLVFLALAEGWLLTELADAIRERWSPSWSAEAMTAVALMVVSLALWPQLWTYPTRLEERRKLQTADEPLADGYYCYYAADYRPSAVVRYLLDRYRPDVGVKQSAYRVCFAHVDHLNLAYYFAQLGLPPASEVDDGTPDRVALLAVALEPPPWQRLAKDCQLSARQIESFHLIGDFGYYRLYQAAEPKDE